MISITYGSLYFRMGSRARFVGRVSFGVGASVGEFNTEIAVTQLRVSVIPVLAQSMTTPVVQLFTVRPAELLVVNLVPELPTLPSPRNRPSEPPTTVEIATFQAWT